MSYEIKETLFAIYGCTDGKMRAVMNGGHGETRMLEDIGVQLLNIAIHHKPFEMMLYAVVDSLREDRDGIQKYFDHFFVEKEIRVGKPKESDDA